MHAAPAGSPTMRFSPVRLFFAAALVVLVIAVLRWQAVLNWLGNYLILTQPPEHADLILVLGGDFLGPRVYKAADLGREGYAPLVLISGPPYRDRPEGDFAVEDLVKHGYPRSLFAVFGHHEPSTIGEVMALGGELRRRHAKHVIFVTSAYHSRRSGIVLRLFCSGIHFISVPAPDEHYHGNGWWRDPSSRELFYSEWSKIFGSIFIAYPTYRFTHRQVDLPHDPLSKSF